MEPMDSPVGTVLLSPDESVIAVRGEDGDGSLIWYMHIVNKFDQDPESLYPGEDWQVIWSFE